MSPERPPRVSVIVPSYDSDATIHACLTALAGQVYRDFEAVVVDSSPSSGCHDAVRAAHPWVRTFHSERRLLPHAARNLGVSHARGELFVHTDPDVYPEPHWLARLVAAHDAGNAVVTGGVGCFGDSWFDWAVHLSKYDSWLPGARQGPVLLAPTANLLCTRALHEEIGGFREQWWIADTLFSWHAAERGHAILFAPAATVHHHHRSSLRGLLRERYARGREFGRLRLVHQRWSWGRRLYMLAVTVLPLRLAKLTARVARHALAAGAGARFGLCSPVVVAAQAAWLAGEATSYAASFFAGSGRT